MKTYNINSIIILLFMSLAFVGCSSDDGKDSELDNPGQVTEERVHQIVVMLVDIIRDSGRNFPQFGQTSGRMLEVSDLNDLLASPNDYLETSNEIGGLKIRLWLDNEGNIIPSPSWQQNHPNYCSNDGRPMRSARKLLEFKVMYDPELGLDYPNQFAFGVQLNLINVDETAAITESVWVDPIISQNNNWINATLNEAWNQMLERATIQGAVGPCEAEISLSLHFSSEVTRTNTDPDGGWVLYDKVEGVIALSFNPDRNAYEGSGSIASVDGWATGVAGDPLYTPYEGELQIFELVTPLLTEGTIEFPFMAMTITIAGSNTYPFEWLLCHGAPNGNYDTSDSGSFAVLIDAWDDIDNPDIVLKKTYSLNDFPLPGTEYGDNIINDHTTIEIRRQ